jgi:hypothetical protein
MPHFYLFMTSLTLIDIRLYTAIGMLDSPPAVPHCFMYMTSLAAH